MGEKEKHPWKPPELAPPMPDFDDFPISAWLKTPPILPKGLYPDEKNYTAVAAHEQEHRTRMIGVEPPLFTTRLMGYERMEAPKFRPKDLEVASITEKIGKTMDKVYDAQMGLLQEQVFASCGIPGEVMFGDIFKDLGLKEDNMDRSLADKKFKKVTIECEDGSTYAGKVTHICGSPYRYNNLCVEAMIEDKPIAAYGIENVIFQNPATIVFWSDGTKTVVNCMDNVEIKKKVVDGKEITIRKPKKADTYSEEAALAMAYHISKKQIKVLLGVEETEEKGTMSEQEMIKKLEELTSEVEKLKANKKSLEERNAQVEKENDDLRKQIEQLESFNAELDATVKEQTEMLNGGKLYENYQEVCIKNSKLNATVDVLVEKISMLKAVGCHG